MVLPETEKRNGNTLISCPFKGLNVNSILLAYYSYQKNNMLVLFSEQAKL